MFHFLQLFLFFIVVVFLLNPHLLLISSQPSHTYFCSNSFKSCLNGERIEYPFYFEYSESKYDCGYPGLSAKCSEGGRPIITLSNHSYYYQFTDDYGVRLVDIDIADQVCPQPMHNFSSEGVAPTLRVKDFTENVTFFYNCSTLPQDVEPNLQCIDNNYSNNATRRSFAMEKSSIPVGFNWYANCQHKVTVPVYDYLSKMNYTEAIKSGVQIELQGSENCLICEESGGSCSYKRNSTSFRCVCPNGVSFDKRCPTEENVDSRNRKISDGKSKEKKISGKFSYVKIKLIVDLSMGGAGSLLIILLFVYIQRCLKTRSTYVEVFLQSYESHGLQRYKYSNIKKMTNSFKDSLGQGGFGSVFKGKLADGRMVAVKLLNESKGKGEEFINEVATIGRTNHVNVTLIGFCPERTKRALVYEFMVNGSLEKFIYKKKSRRTTYAPALGGEKIHQIALGIARGLEYLHRGCNNRILHFDIKHHNILLDSEFVPKISDFGLAKLSQTKESVVSMVGTRGTRGYIAPEVSCRNFGVVSYKSDVYSYGMMLFEMIGGRKNLDATVENISEIYFSHWIYNHINKEKEIEESEDMEVNVSKDILHNEIAKKMIIVALWCIQAHPNSRPSMKLVAEMLEATNDKLQMPPNPSLQISSDISPILS